MINNDREQHGSPKDAARVASEPRKPGMQQAEPKAQSALSASREAERNQQEALESGAENTT